MKNLFTTKIFLNFDLMAVARAENQIIFTAHAAHPSLGMYGNYLDIKTTHLLYSISPESGIAGSPPDLREGVGETGILLSNINGWEVLEAGLEACRDDLWLRWAEIPRFDVGVPRRDAGVPRRDAGVPQREEGVPRCKAGESPLECTELVFFTSSGKANLLKTMKKMEYTCKNQSYHSVVLSILRRFANNQLIIIINS